MADLQESASRFGSLANTNSAFQSQIRVDRAGRIGGNTKRPGGAGTPRAMADTRGGGDMQEPTETALWRQRLEEKLEIALGETRDNVDPSASISLAEVYSRAWAGEATDDELDDLREYEERREPECICPPDLLERGGFRGGCPVHA